MTRQHILDDLVSHALLIDAHTHVGMEPAQYARAIIPTACRRDISMSVWRRSGSTSWQKLVTRLSLFGPVTAAGAGLQARCRRKISWSTEHSDGKTLQIAAC